MTNTYWWKEPVIGAQLCVESTTELCRLDGPEAGTGVPLGKKLKTRPWYRKPVSCFSWRGLICSEFSNAFLSTIIVTPGLAAVQEPKTRKTTRRPIRHLVLRGIFVELEGEAIRECVWWAMERFKGRKSFENYFLQCEKEKEREARLIVIYACMGK